MKWLALLVVWTLPAPAGSEDPYAALRERMVREQIASRDVTDAGVLRAMRETPRHEFVPEGFREQAYEDHPLPIGHGQTISQPYIVAFMTEALDVSRAHRVLEIGTGSGYQAAVLSPLAGRIYTIEIVPALAADAARKLQRYGNVIVREGDGYAGWPEAAPFDRIILTAAPPKIPETLLDQLKPGGKLLAPEGSSPWTQKLVLVEKLKDGRTRRTNLLPVIFVPMVRGP